MNMPANCTTDSEILIGLLPPPFCNRRFRIIQYLRMSLTTPSSQFGIKIIKLRLLCPKWFWLIVSRRRFWKESFWWNNAAEIVLPVVLDNVVQWRILLAATIRRFFFLYTIVHSTRSRVPRFVPIIHRDFRKIAFRTITRQEHKNLRR